MANKDPELLAEADFPVEFGRYVLTGLLGEVGMGRVFRARTNGSGAPTKEVAVKLMRTSAVRQDTNLSHNLENEAQLGFLLNHHSIVSTLEFDRVNATPMIVMELLRGVTLEQFLVRGLPSEATISKGQQDSY